MVYVSPIKALAVDVNRNLRAPLQGITDVAALMGLTARPLEVAVRSGDTPQSARERMRRHPPDILITTPESLFLILTSNAREMLRGVDTVILDEIHAVVGSKRGAHLALSIERLEEFAGRRLQRIGLSATVQPLDAVAEFMAGSRRGRNVEIVDASSQRPFDIRIETVAEDLKRMTLRAERSPSSATTAPESTSIWPAIHERVLDLILAPENRSTIVFVNSRRLAERVAAALNELAEQRRGASERARDGHRNEAPQTLVRAHHGSLAKDEREIVEGALKRGDLRVVVATSSLELGIDMGAVDLVLQIETPPSIANAIQRIGRAAHHLGGVPKGTIFPLHRGDLLSAVATVEGMQKGEVEPVGKLENPLDVLAQHILSILAVHRTSIDDLFALCRRAAPFAKLPRSVFEGVLDMLAGRYPSHDFSDLRPRIVWDRTTGFLHARDAVKRLLYSNSGTIPDRGLFPVYLSTAAAVTNAKRVPARRVGELDEEMVFESRVGDVVMLGASSWRVDEIGRDRVLVSPAPGLKGRMPFWKAESASRPIANGLRIGRHARSIATGPAREAERRLLNSSSIDASSARNLVAYVREQKAQSALPDDRTLVLERSRDDMGDLRLCLLSFLGGRVHQPLLLAILRKLKAQGIHETEAVASNDGIVFRLPDRERPPTLRELLPYAHELEALVREELSASSQFAARFREAAFRALLLPRRAPGARSPLWAQRQKSHALLSVASRYPEFPLILEAYRECLQDDFDLGATLEVLKQIERREIRLVDVETERPSPFAAHLLFGYVANYMYEGDSPLAERRAHSLAVDEMQLRELLGETALGELLDPHVVADVTREASGLVAEWKIDGPDRDALHDLLLRFGDLTRGEIRLRFVKPEDGDRAILSALEARLAIVAKARTRARTDTQDDERIIAVEDASRYVVAAGFAIDLDAVPPALRTSPKDPLRDLAVRYARTHGPFEARTLAARFAIDETRATAVLGLLESERVLSRGPFSPNGSALEFASSELVAKMRQRSLAKARHETKAVSIEAYAHFLQRWHGMTPASDAASDEGGMEALLGTIEQIQGHAVPFSILETDVLRSRIPGYRSQDLDLAVATGEVRVVGRGALPGRDGRVALYPGTGSVNARHPAASSPNASRDHDGSLERAIREVLEGRALFFHEIVAAVPNVRPAELVDALWTLFWSGEATNDAVAALRARVWGGTTAQKNASRRAFSRSPRYRSRLETPRDAVGRWSLIENPLSRQANATQDTLTAIEDLIACYGVVTREALVAHGLGFGTLYPALRALEERGKIRRGYFVEGIGALQFADASAVDGLRRSAEETPNAIVISAIDPAQPFGIAVPWPEALRGLAERSARFHLVSRAGVVGAVIESLGRRVSVVEPSVASPQAAEAYAQAIAGWMKRQLIPQIGWEVGGDTPLNRSALAPDLQAAGLQPIGPGFRLPRA